MDAGADAPAELRRSVRFNDSSGSAHMLKRSNLLLASPLLLAIPVAGQENPLPSWNAGTTKTAIVEAKKKVGP